MHYHGYKLLGSLSLFSLVEADSSLPLLNWLMMIPIKKYGCYGIWQFMVLSLAV